MKSATRRIRILHVLGGMVRGGSRHGSCTFFAMRTASGFRWIFLSIRRSPAPMTTKSALSAETSFRCLHPARPWTYARNFRRALAAHGRYDIVHSHVYHYSGYVLRLARRAGVPVRIAHSHVDVMPGMQRRHHADFISLSRGAGFAAMLPRVWRPAERQRMRCSAQPGGAIARLQAASLWHRSGTFSMRR